jgi:hypothetical protein
MDGEVETAAMVGRQGCIVPSLDRLCVLIAILPGLGIVKDFRVWTRHGK